MLSDILVGAFFTVTTQLAVLLLSVFTVMVAVPAFLAVILPLFDTVTTETLLLLQLYPVTTFAGVTDFIRVYVSPTPNVMLDLLSEIVFTAVKPKSCATLAFACCHVIPVVNAPYSFQL